MNKITNWYLWFRAEKWCIKGVFHDEKSTRAIEELLSISYVGSERFIVHTSRGIYEASLASCILSRFNREVSTYDTLIDEVYGALCYVFSSLSKFHWKTTSSELANQLLMDKKNSYTSLGQNLSEGLTLFFDGDLSYSFVEGIYRNGDMIHYIPDASIHLGMTTDSCLIDRRIDATHYFDVRYFTYISNTFKFYVADLSIGKLILKNIGLIPLYVGDRGALQPSESICIDLG